MMMRLIESGTTGPEAREELETLRKEIEGGEKRRIAVVVGSDSDLPQCAAGLEALLTFEERSEIEIVAVFTMSIHRNMAAVLRHLKQWHEQKTVNVIIAGAGWAAHLPGMIDAYLRYELKDTHTVVFGVALEDDENERHTLAAQLSISEVPGTQLVFDDHEGQFVGEYGFRRACIQAAEGGLPTPTVSKPREAHVRSVREVLATFGR
jgi:phosphoribosylcarboxyaminoimidazole (NCAIR) mutase